MKRKQKLFAVHIGNSVYREVAKTPGAAAHKVFRQCINAEQLDRRPPADGEGGWKDVVIECEGDV